MPLSEKSIAVITSFAVFLIWTLATYLLEGRLLTLQRPEAVLNRFIYAIVVNVLIGTVGSIILIRFLLLHTGVSNPSLFGLIGPKRLILGIALGLVLGLVFFFAQSFSSRHPILILNAYSQVLVVSIAEVVVCWVLVGGSIANLGKNPIYMFLAVIISSFLFGLYHFGHSPPFNSFKMVMMLSIVGLFTGVFYFLTRSIYGTILFHNFMGMKGVTDALADSGRIESFKSFQIPIVATAIIAVVILIVLDVMLLRRAAGFQQ
ncbi:MAG: CPBP family intramembrane metalloprotease [Desulfobacterales bacterium]|jgi:hypothetical protein